MDLQTDAAAAPRYAGFWVRVAAALIDTLALGLLIGLLLKLLGRAVLLPQLVDGDLLGLGSGMGDGDWTAELLFAALVITFWLTMRGTPGKLILGLEVVDADTLGTLGLGQSIGRYLGYFLSTIPFCLGLIWVGLDARKQGWHDKLAGTLVIHKAKAP